MLIGPEYVTFRSDPNNDHVTDGEWCGQRKILLADLVDWKRRTPEASVLILEKRRTRYAEMLSDVDKALFDKALAGDSKSVELVYRRFENWTPRQAEDALKKNPTHKSFTEMMAEDDDDET